MCCIFTSRAAWKSSLEKGWRSGRYSEQMLRTIGHFVSPIFPLAAIRCIVELRTRPHALRGFGSTMLSKLDHDSIVKERTGKLFLQVASDSLAVACFPAPVGLRLAGHSAFGSRRLAPSCLLSARGPLLRLG